MWSTIFLKRFPNIYILFYFILFICNKQGEKGNRNLLILELKTHCKIIHIENHLRPLENWVLIINNNKNLESRLLETKNNPSNE
jgi:hypothetical protein